MTRAASEIETELSEEEELLHHFQREVNRLEEKIERTTSGLLVAALDVAELNHSDSMKRVDELREELKVARDSQREWLLRFMDGCGIYQSKESERLSADIERLHPDELHYRDTGPDTPWLPVTDEEREKLLKGEVE